MDHIGGRFATAAALLFVMLAACDDPSRYLRNEPPLHEWGTFGEELYRLLHESAEASADRGDLRAEALAERRDPVVEALDLTLPPTLYDPARDALAATLERIDDETLPRVTRSTSALLIDLGEDRPTLDAALRVRDGRFAAGRDELIQVARHLALVPTEDGGALLVPLTASMLRLARDHDGRGPGGSLVDDEPREVRELARALARELEHLDLEEVDEAHPFDTSLVERLLAAILLSPEAPPVWAVRVDHRGLPRVALDPDWGRVYEPFVDDDGDGLADTGPDGELLHTASDPAEIAIYGRTRHHASDGRALAADGRPLYEYVDVTRSGLGAAAFALHRMVRDGVHDDLIHLVDDLLSPRVPAFDERDGTYYESFPPERTESLEPGFDLIWALLEATREQPPDRLLYGAEELLRRNRSDLRNLVEQGLLAADEVEELDVGGLAEHNTLLDDLLLDETPPGAICYGTYDADLNLTCTEPPGPLGPRLIETGILRDLLALLDAPELDGLAPALADLMTHRDDPIYGDATSLRWAIQSRPEAADNRSVFQRLAHLVHDTNGASYSTLLGEVLIDWRIENMAVFYLDSYCAGDEELVPSLALLVLGDYFESARPSPYEIAKFMVVDHEDEFPVWANPTGREGRPLWQYNADTLLALEFTGMNDAMRPLVQVFCDHDELLLLANLFSVLHEHYSTLPEYTTDMTARYDFYEVERPAGVRAYEAAIARVITNTEVVDMARTVGFETTRVTVDGEPLVDEVIAFASHLIDPDAAVRLRLHDDPSRDAIRAFDGLTPMSHPTHLNVLLQRAEESLDAWDSEDPQVRENLTAISDLLAEYLLDWPGEDALRRDQAEYVVSMLERSVPVLADWSRENIERGTWDDEMADARQAVDDLEAWLDELSQDPLLPAVLDVALLLLDDPVTGPLLRDLLLYFSTPPTESGIDQGGLRDPYTANARLLVALIQLLPDVPAFEQLARFAARALDPDRSPLAQTPADLARLTGASPDSVALRAGVGALAPGVPSDPDRVPPILVLAEALAAMGREDPTVDAPLSADDLQRLTERARELLDDHVHGLERVYDIVESRERE